MSRRKSAQPVAPEYPPSIFEYEPGDSDCNKGRDPSPLIVRSNDLIRSAWFLQIQGAAPAYVHRHLCKKVRGMSLSPYKLLNTAHSIASSANNPLPFKRNWQNEPVYLSDQVPHITVAGRTATVAEYIRAAEAVHTALSSMLAELPVGRPLDAYTVLQTLLGMPGTLPPSKRAKAASRLARYISDSIAGSPFRAMPRGVGG